MTAPEKPGLSNEELKPYNLVGDLYVMGPGLEDDRRYGIAPDCLEAEHLNIAYAEGFKAGRSQEAPQGKREWSLEVEDARTLAAYWLMTDERSRREMWQSDIKKICEQLLKATEVQAALSGGRDDRWEKEVQKLLDETEKFTEFYCLHQDPKILQKELEAEGIDVEGTKKRILAKIAELKSMSAKEGV